MRQIQITAEAWPRECADRARGRIRRVAQGSCVRLGVWLSRWGVRASMSEGSCFLNEARGDVIG